MSDSQAILVPNGNLGRDANVMAQIAKQLEKQSVKFVVWCFFLLYDCI